MCEINIGNLKYTTFTKLVQVQNFITFELKVIRYEERDHGWHPICKLLVSVSVGPESQPSRSDAVTQLTAFLKSPKSSADASSA